MHARDDSYRDEFWMSIQVTVRSIVVVLCFAGLAAAQGPPSLEPPTLEPPVADGPQPRAPATPRPAAVVRQGDAQPAPARPEAGPMLAIPGVTAPTPRPQTAGRPQAANPSQPGMSPFSVTPSGSIGIPSVDALPKLSRPDSFPMTIGPLLDDESSERTPAGPPGPRPIPRRTPGASTSDPPDEDKERSTPKPAPRRAPGLLG